LLSSAEIPVGLAYFNVGNGFSCGGRYLWINALYVDEPHRGKGLGSVLLQAIEAYGIDIGAHLIMSTRDRENVASEAVFSRLDYTETLLPVIEKRIPFS
ncbi:MAG: GNAT family N-acetyltransferase, partial [Verrucomicrobiota bacterium]